MKKEVYLILDCPKKEFRDVAKKGFKCEMIVYKCYCAPVWATATKEEALADCIRHNKLTFSESLYFMIPIHLYKK